MNGGRRVHIVAVLCAIVLRGATAAQAPLFLGAVREDGLLIPIAVHDGREWWNAWPFSYEGDKTITRLKLPRSTAAIPKDWLPPGLRLPAKWTLQLRQGGSLPLQLRGFERSPRFGMAFIGVRTSYEPRPRAEIADDGYEVGVAINGPGSLLLVDEVETSSAEYEALITALRPHFNDAESRALAREIEARRTGSAATEPRIALPSELERANRPFSGASALKTRTSTPGESVYYVTALRDYGQQPYPDCDLSVAMSAFVTRTVDGKLQVRAAGADTPLECGRDFAVSSYLDVLAALEWSGPMLWIVRSSVEDGFSYQLVDPLAADPFTVPVKGLWDLRR